MFKSVIIKKVESIPVGNLSGMKIVSSDECRFDDEPQFTEINIRLLADVRVSDSLDGNVRKFTTVLTFSVCDHSPSFSRRLAYRLTAADGTQFMIGTNKRPYAITTENIPFPDSPTESLLKKITVKWTSAYPMLKVVS